MTYVSLRLCLICDIMLNCNKTGSAIKLDLDVTARYEWVDMTGLTPRSPGPLAWNFVNLILSAIYIRSSLHPVPRPRPRSSDLGNRVCF